MRWVNQLDRMERLVAARIESAGITGVRVAGQSRSEIAATMLARLFASLAAAPPVMATDIVLAALGDQPWPLDLPPRVVRCLDAIRAIDRQNPGLPSRVLEAVLTGAESIDEETVFPAGRPLLEQTFYSRQGQRFRFALRRAARV